MTELKTAAAAVADTLNTVAEIERKAADAVRERDTLRAELEALDAAVDAAEQEHAEALAAVQLGERENADDTSIRLAVARDAAKARPDLAMRSRVSESVVASLEGRHREAVAKYTTAIESVKAARIKLLEGKAQQAMEAARESVSTVATRMAEVHAVVRALEAAGGHWMGGSFDPVTALSTARPDAAAIELMASALSRELQAA
ncbi:MAG: hypothetical protein MUE59_02685 [Thiobacillaceae bacterium]|jgi:chromosome segregation ATPase|nr:hypothetical protein [Thiobacillaceae bacterium]